jgi:hypothetical protein
MACIEYDTRPKRWSLVGNRPTRGIFAQPGVLLRESKLRSAIADRAAFRLDLLTEPVEYECALVEGALFITAVPSQVAGEELK